MAIRGRIRGRVKLWGWCRKSLGAEGFKTFGYPEGHRRSVCRAFGASHHAAEGAGAGGGGLAAGFAGEEGGLVDIAH